jgi:hypothetical protein
MTRPTAEETSAPANRTWPAKLEQSRWVDVLLGTRPGNGAEIDGAHAPGYADRLAREIGAEHALVTARMTWTLSLQGFLFTAFALAMNVGATAASDDRLDTLLCVLPIAGLVTAALGLVGMGAAFVRINALKRIWHANSIAFKQTGPQPFSTTLGGFAGRLPPVAISLALIGCWSALLWPAAP